ncbi:MAG: DUF1453 domain-containing protein [Vicinamibacteraceae bacterium]
MPLLILLLVLPLVMIALMPLILVQRYRMGKARRLARPWVSTVNVALTSLSAVLFLTVAGVTTIWVPHAFSGAALGIVLGLGLGLVGLLLTNWEPTPATLHYTPNRWLVLLVTLMVSARVVYGLWRSLKVAQAGIYGTAMVMAFGIPESLGVGGAVIGYYIAYAWGVRRRLVAWQRRPLRVMRRRLRAW